MKKIYKYSMLPVLLLSACSDDVMHIDSPDAGLRDGEVRINAEIDQVNLTRADDSGFADGDVIGVFAVDFENGHPGTLLSAGNNADNVDFTFDEQAYSWSGSRSVLFEDDKTPMDLYGYYPYIKGIVDVNNLPISVESNQAGESKTKDMSAYEASDFLWAKESGLTSSNPNTTLFFKHILASIRVTLTEGTGFETGEWSELNKFVLINNTRRNATVNLATATVTCNGDKDGLNIVARNDKNDFRAIVIPQSVPSGDALLTITVDNHNYTFTKNVKMDYIQGKQHNFTIEVNKNTDTGDYEFNLINESITAWESDSESHNGNAKGYISIHVDDNQSLEEAFSRENISYSGIKNLKITGSINDQDIRFIRDNMRNIEALNLKEVQISNLVIPEFAFTNLITLRHIVLPDKLERIEEFAFGGTILEGSLKIPDGVKYIGNGAFSNFWDENSGYSALPGGKLLANNNLTGTLELPESLEYIGEDAFRCCDFTGTLKLPHSLKYVGKNAFNGCKNFTGEIHFPDKLVEIDCDSWSNLKNGEGAFYGMTGLSGNLELPRNLKVINGFGGLKVSNVLFSENAREIGAYAFMNLDVKGSIDIPESVTTIGNYAFYSCTSPYISLPTSLTRIAAHSFARCRNLCDTLSIPNNVEVIDEGAFRECEKLFAVTLPSKLTHISGYAFMNCFSLEYIHCDAKEPPILDETAFNGVEKDNFTIEVPEESVDAYRNAPGWSEFKRISAYKNFVARPSKYNVLNKGGKKEIILNANAEWEMIECPSWCDIDKKTGNKKTSILLTVDAMPHGSAKRDGIITFRLKGDTEYLTHINVGQYDYEYDEDSYIVLNKATKGKGVNLFLVGDGYDAADISSGMFLNDMKQTMEYFFAVEPYTTYKDYFNVYTGISMSEDSGVEEINRWRITKFHTRIPSRCSEHIQADYVSALNYCADICPDLFQKQDSRTGVILLANYTGYDGVTYLGDNFCSVVTKSEKNYPYDARGLVQHEAGGHGIGWLADEYIYHSDFIQRCECSCCAHVDELTGQQSWGYGLNVSLKGGYKDVDWSHLIFNPKYGDIVDIYEGAYFHQRGVYRSEYNSCMNNNVPYFSTWSRQLIVQRIMKLAGEEFSLEKFYANDKRDMGQDFTTSRSGVDRLGSSYHSAPPVFIKNFKFNGKKGGKR